ncbi:MAG: pitrilysin family protein, partial [Patescibacteria group bacterium]
VVNNKLGKALDILSDMMFNSKFEEEEIEREKGVIIEELNMYRDNPRLYIEDVFEECLYGDTPAGWDTIGTKKNILKFKRKDFIKYFQAQYGTRSVYLVVAGAIKPSDKKMIHNLFSGFKSHKFQEQKPLLEKQKQPQLKIIPKKTDQLTLSLGVRTFSINHPDEFKLKLLSVILGGSMSSRLFINLRERQGLAYFVRTGVEFYKNSGYLATQAGVPKDKITLAIKIILAEYKKLTKELVSPQELKRAKDILQGRMVLQMEASDNLALWYAQQAIWRHKFLTPADTIKKIKKIKATDIRALAKKIFINKGLNLAIIGLTDKQTIKKILKF